MPYPYPKIGSAYLSGTYPAEVAKKTGCSPVESATNPVELAGLHGFGYRSPVVKSDLFKPTNYQVYWSEVDKGKSVTISSQTTLCSERFDFWPYDWKVYDFYRPSGNSSVGRLFTSPAITHMNNGRTPGLSNGSLTTITYKLGAITRLRSDHANMIQSLDNMILAQVASTTNMLGVTLAESLKSSRYLISKVKEVGAFLVMLYKSPKRFFKYLRRNYKKWSGNLPPKARTHYRRKTVSKLRRRAWDERIGGRWLEYNYAVMPMLYDAEGFLKFYDPSTVPPLLFSVKKRGELSSTTSSSGLSYVFVKSNIKYKFLVGRSFATDDHLSANFRRLGITPSQLSLGTIWELIPFSFVADWVINLGSFFEGMSAMQGVRYLHGFASIKMEATEHVVETTSTNPMIAEGFGDFSRVPSAPSSPRDIGKTPPIPSGSCKPFRYRTSAFRRIVLSNPPVPTWEIPGFSGIGSLNYVTLLSLVGVLRSKRKIDPNFKL